MFLSVTPATIFINKPSFFRVDIHMGRIKTKLIKSKTRELIEENPDKFSKDFEENKKQLAETAKISSKKMRNAIAGYLVRKKKE